MARASEKSWSDLRLGLVVFAIMVVVGVVVFFAGARRGPFLPDTYTLYVELSEAGGIRVGSPIRVGGLSAGEVADVDIIPARRAPPPAASDTLEPLTEIPDLRDIRVELSVHEKFQPFITSSSRAELASIGLGGERYVKISAGDVTEDPLPPDGVIPARPSIDWDLLLAKLSRAFNEMRAIAETSDEIRETLASGDGTLPRFLDKSSPVYGQIEALRQESNSFLATLESGSGIIPQWSADPRLERRLDSLAMSLRELAEDIEHEDGALRRWVEARELRAALRDTRAEVEHLDRALESGGGTVGRLLHDEELWMQIRVLQHRIADLVEAFRSDPLGFVDIDLF